MRWTLKARLQNAVSLFPSSVSYAAYYWLQRHFGGLRNVSPVRRLTEGIDTWRRLGKFVGDPTGKVFFEVGTGRAPVVPLAYWLMGAHRTVTVDVNPYLRAELIQEHLQYISDHRDAIKGLFGSYLDASRLDDLMQFHNSARFSIREFLDLCRIHYIAPGDAAKTGLEARSIDFHTSCMVLEHIPPQVLERIVAEGNRIIRDDGLFIHRIDYSDHFAHSDKSITPLNFLQYSDSEWERYAGNRYMYMNRLRHDDYVTMFQASGHRILAADLDENPNLLEMLKNGTLRLSERFKDKRPELLSVTGSWIVSRKERSGPPLADR